LVCGTTLSGALVTVKSGGTTIASGTTVSGTVTLNIGSAGTYDITISKAGLTSGVQTKALTCSGIVTWDFGPHDSSLSLTDANTTLSTGAGTLTYLGGSPRKWTGSYCHNYTSAKCTDGATNSGPINITYDITCEANGTVTVNRKWPEADNAFIGFGTWFWLQVDVLPCTYSSFAGCGSRNTNNAIKNATPSSYVPFAWSASMGAPTGHTGDPVGGTVTLS
jgi:hypothetical protein